MVDHSLGEAFFLNNAKASLYMATTFENTASTIMKIHKILSFFVAML